MHGLLKKFIFTPLHDLVKSMILGQHPLIDYASLKLIEYITIQPLVLN